MPHNTHLRKSAWLVFSITAMINLGCATPLSQSTKFVSKLDKARAVSHLQKAQEYLLKKPDHTKAKTELDLALASDPYDIRTILWSAWTNSSLLQKDAAFENLLSAARQQHPAAQLAISSAYDAIDSRTQVLKLESVLKRIINDKKTHPLVRTRAIHYLGLVLRYLGRFDEASKMFSNLAYVSQWMVVGPFDNDQNSGFDRAYAPETGPISLDMKYKGKQREISWKKVRYFDFDGRVSLSAIMDPSRWSAAYLVTWINSESERDVAFRLAAFRGIKLWLNGRLLLADDQARTASLDQYAAGGRLSKGWNLLLVKVCQRKGPWQLGLRITDLDGNKVSGLRFDTSFHESPDFSTHKDSLPKPLTMLSQLESSPDDPFIEAVRILWYTKQGFYPKAIEEAEAFASRFPKSVMARLFLSRVYFLEARDSKAVKALEQANNLNPELPEVILSKAQYEQGRKRYARAMKYLKPLMEKMPDNAEVRAGYIYLLAARGWHPEALRQAQAFASTHPDRPWSWMIVASEQARLNRYSMARASYRKALALRKDNKKIYDQLVNMAVNAGDLNSALDMVRKRTKVFPRMISAALQEATIQIAAGRLQQALAVCLRLEKIAPDYWLIHKTRGDVLMLLGRRQKAIASYGKSLECYPDNPSLQEYMDHLEAKKDPVFEKYALGQQRIDSILSNPPEHSRYPEADAVLLCDDQITHVFKDGFARHKVHQVYWIRTQRAQQRFSKFRVPSTSSFRLEVAQTILPNGTRQDATSIRRGVIHLPSIQPGALIDVAYSYTSQSKTWMEDHYADSFYFQSKNPVAFSRWVLALPSSRKLHVKVVGNVVKHIQEKLAGDQVHIWTARDVPMIHSDMASPPFRELAAAVYVSTIADWDAVARWESSLIQDQFETDEAIRKKTDELIAGKTDKMQKIEALYGFVVQKVRYLYHDVGIFGKKPNQAANVFANKYGDCKDKSTLLIAMLRYAGIEAYYSAIRTRNKGPVFWEVPCAQTNHAITYIPAQPGIEKEMFVDPTATFFNMYTLPEQDQGVKALVITKDGYKIVPTPVQTRVSSMFNYDLKLNIDANQAQAPAKLQGKATWTGWAAANHRQVYRAEGKRMERFSNELAFLYAGAILDTVTFFGLDSLEKSASAEFSAHIPGLVRTEGASLRINPLWPSKVLSLYSQRPSRHYDMFLAYTMNQDAKVTLAIPSGFKVSTSPSVEQVQTPVFSYSTGCVEKGGNLQCHRKIIWHLRRLKKSDYADFRKACTKISILENRDVVLEPIEDTPKQLKK